MTDINLNFINRWSCFQFINSRELFGKLLFYQKYYLYLLTIIKLIKRFIIKLLCGILATISKKIKIKPRINF